MNMKIAIDCKKGYFLTKLQRLLIFVATFMPLLGQVLPTTIVGPVFDAFGNLYTGSFTIQ